MEIPNAISSRPRVELVLTPKSCSVAALSMQFASLPDMLWTMPARPASWDVHEACRYCQPRSECMAGGLGILTAARLEHPDPAGHVGRGRYVARHDLPAAEVCASGPVGLAARHLELSDVRSQLPPRGPGVNPSRSRSRTSCRRRPVRVIPVVGRLASDTAANPHLAHHLSTVLSAITAPSSALRHIAICRCPQPLAAREDLGAPPPRARGALWPRQVREGVVGRPLELGACEQVPERVPLGAQGRDRFGLRPGQSPVPDQGA